MAGRSVLITGCSDRGLGSILALELHKKGFRVIATARNPAKLNDVKAAGIETLILDVLSEESIKKCAHEVWQLTGGSLDMLVNNAGMAKFFPIVDIPIDEAKKQFDLNVWAALAMIQAFLPLLLKSPHGGTIVNHTSSASVVAPPFNGIYGAAKAALAMLTTVLRSELLPFGIKVVELKSGNTRSNLGNHDWSKSQVPENSIYYPAREWLNKLFSVATLDVTPSDVWVKKVSAALVKDSPPHIVWAGSYTWLTWFASRFLPTSVAEGISRKVVRLDLVQKSIDEYGREKIIADVYGGN